MEIINQYGLYLFYLALFASLMPIFGLSIGITMFRHSLDYFFALRGATLFTVGVFIATAAYDYFFGLFTAEFYLAIIFALAYFLMAIREVSIPYALRVEIKM